MKITTLNFIFGILLFTINANVLVSQVKIMDINNISIFETKDKSGKLSYSGIGPNGSKVPVSITYLKAADITNKNNGNKTSNCSYSCFPCGNGNTDLCCLCKNDAKSAKVLLEKITKFKKVYEEPNFKLYKIQENKDTGYLGLDNNGNYVQTKVNKPKGPITIPGDECYKCTMQGKVKVCEFFPCKK
ncbi:MAG: hypothetical protein IPK88_02865 [Saprospiraceae bacterium]|uniref:Uncharacterized protein n=1 Tax=Candidatus Defluviibacterium haderslevense TaxID=2981993 RepID=A0A9D7S8G7_9BACT|nr:hypothetical protein [Candidatus Defluviibacterium haderslevense]MBK9717067.1 hypothetical protein [Candidatus Defluviibacterium haderslevense]